MTRPKFDLSAPRGRIKAYWDMVMVDHGIFRLIWTNGARVSDQLRRSNHPMPYRVGWLKRRGINTIVNLRAATIRAGTCSRPRPARGTASSSSIPVGTGAPCVRSTSVIGTAAAGCPATTVGRASSTSSTREFHASQARQRPAHFGAEAPHSVQR